MEKTKRETLLRIAVSFGTHALGKDVAYNADKRAGPHAHQSLPIRPFVLINFIKAKAGEGSSAARLAQTGALEPSTAALEHGRVRVPALHVYHRLARWNLYPCGAGTCFRQGG